MIPGGNLAGHAGTDGHHIGVAVDSVRGGDGELLNFLADFLDNRDRIVPSGLGQNHRKFLTAIAGG